MINDPAFLEGRRAAILSDGRKIGVLGEMHPNVISNFGLQQPTVGFEMVL
jgi:phenylalanyl-tRNA synthetase beta chain